jgi:secreted trypsin-like serine protease
VKFRIVAVGLCGWVFAGCGADMGAEPTEDRADEIVRGTLEKHMPQVVAVSIRGFGGNSFCSGTYIADRVVLTAAHCIRTDSIPGQTFVYHGKDYPTDSATLPSIPAPGERSKFARAESVIVHPAWNAGSYYPDLAILLLDRELPFKPLQLERHAISKWEKHGTIVGWGASKSLNAGTTQVEGAFIKRSATVKLLGSPTAADYHADDPNPGILDAAIRPHLLKTDGRDPRSNTCSGDSGGPLLVDQHGRDRVAAVNFWTGLWCEDYGMFTRVEPFLDFIDDETKRAGDANIVPRLECVEEAEDGSLTAHFGYQNDNGVTVEVRHGFRNSFPRDTDDARPEDFGPGNNPFAFSVAIPEGKTLTWRLKAGTTTTVTADASSVRCDPDNQTLICAETCDAQLGAECQAGASRSQCISNCEGNAYFFQYMACGERYNNYLSCVATVPPAAENWACDIPGIPPDPRSPNCEFEFNDAIMCLYGY